MSIPVATAIGFVVAMVVAVVLAATAGSGKSERSQKRATGGPLTVLGACIVYLVVLLPLFTNPGITLWPLVLLFVAVALPVALAGRSNGSLAKFGGPARTLIDLVAVVTAFVLLVGQLAAAGAVLSLFGGVNPILATAALGLCCFAYLLGSGRPGSIRTSRYAVLALVVAAIVFVAGAYLGSAASLVAPLVPSQPLAPGVVVAALLVVAVLGVFDPNARLAISGSARPRRALSVGLVLAVITVAFLGIGGMMVFGGVFQAPDLEIMTVFAVLPPIGVLIMMLVVAFILASNVDSLLSAGAAAATASSRPPRSAAVQLATAGLALVAVIAAVAIPNPLLFLTVGAVVAVSALGALLPFSRRPGGLSRPWWAFAAGVIVGILLAVALGPGDVAALSLDTVTVLVGAGVVAGLVSAFSGRSIRPESLIVQDYEGT